MIAIAMACCDHLRMEETTGRRHVPAAQQIAEAIAAEQESLSPQCRADASRLERLLAPDFHDFGD